MKDAWQLFARYNSSMLRNLPQPSVRYVGETELVSLVGAADRLLIMGIDFFILLQELQMQNYKPCHLQVP